MAMRKQWADDLIYDARIYTKLSAPATWGNIYDTRIYKIVSSCFLKNVVPLAPIYHICITFYYLLEWQTTYTLGLFWRTHSHSGISALRV